MAKSRDKAGLLRRIEIGCLVEHHTERSATGPKLVFREDFTGEIVGLLLGQVNVPALIGPDRNALPADREAFPLAGEGLSKTRAYDRAPSRPEVMKADPDETGVRPGWPEPPRDTACLIVEADREVPGARGWILVARTVVQQIVGRDLDGKALGERAPSRRAEDRV